MLDGVFVLLSRVQKGIFFPFGYMNTKMIHALSVALFMYEDLANI